jgi:microcin C transport system permease protein
LIPIATGIGHLIGVFLAGSYLIERVFNIDGLGMLGFTSILSRDYPVTLGFLVIAGIIRLMGNLTSDMTYALVDPRIRFK